MANGATRDPNQWIKGQPKEVTISFDGKQLSCDPDPVQLYWESGPDSVVWRINSASPDVSIAVMFKQDACFNACGLAADGRVLGTNNTRVTGAFEYAAIAYRPDGSVAAVLDPKVVNDPVTPP